MRLTGEIRLDDDEVFHNGEDGQVWRKGTHFFDNVCVARLCLADFSENGALLLFHEKPRRGERSVAAVPVLRGGFQCASRIGAVSHRSHKRTRLILPHGETKRKRDNNPRAEEEYESEREKLRP